LTNKYIMLIYHFKIAILFFCSSPDQLKLVLGGNMQ